MSSARAARSRCIEAARAAGAARRSSTRPSATQRLFDAPACRRRPLLPRAEENQMTKPGVHPRRLSDRLRPQLDEGGQAHLGDDPRSGRRAASPRPASSPARSRSATSATSPPSSTRCRATSARSSSTSTRRSPGCRRAGTRRRARRARSRSSRRRRRSRPAATTARCVVGVEQMKTVVAGAGRRLPRHRGLVRARGQGRRVPVPQAVRQARRRVRPPLRPQGRAPRAHLARSTTTTRARTRRRRRAPGT